MLLLASAVSFCFTSINAQDKTGFTAYWDKTFHVKSNDGNFSMQFGGRIHQHWSSHSFDQGLENIFGASSSGAEFRRVRFFNSGTIYNNINYKLQLEFAGGSTQLKDAYLSLTKLPVIGTITLGHFKEPFGLDQYNSSNDMSFIERAPNFDMTPGRNNGFMISNNAFQNRILWAFGAFRDTDNFGYVSSGGKFNISGRIAGTPVFNKEKNLLLHIGAAYSYRTTNAGEYRLKSRPEANMVPVLINTGIIDQVKNLQLIGTEFAVVLNALSFQAEYIQAIARRIPEATDEKNNFSGYYVEASFFLTGEHRVYSNKVAFFKRVSPKKNFNPAKGSWGAFELVARYSGSDYSDSSVTGGVLNIFSAGLNWHLNPATKFLFNYSNAELIDKGRSNILQTKLQLVF